MFRCAGLKKTYGGITVVDAVEFSVQNGEMAALFGRSGSGKSTILGCISGFVSPDAGEMTLHGVDLGALPPERRGTIMVFQKPYLFDHKSVFDNVAFSLRLRRLSAEEICRRTEALLEMLEIRHLAERKPQTLSGGEAQRVALGRALAADPSMLLLDEPFSALDEKIRAGMRTLVRRVQKSLDIPAILVTHDREEAMRMADVMLYIEEGRILERGTPEEMYHRPRRPETMRFLRDGKEWRVRVQGGMIAHPLFAHLPASPLPDGEYLLFVPVDAVRPGDLRAQVEDVGCVGDAYAVTAVLHGDRVEYRLPMAPGVDPRGGIDWIGEKLWLYHLGEGRAYRL